MVGLRLGARQSASEPSCVYVGVEDAGPGPYPSLLALQNALGSIKHSSKSDLDSSTLFF